MSLVWGLPLGLVALAAVLVPLVLHLDRRRAVRVLPFAAMRWIADRHRPRRTLRLSEWWLLLLRVLLVACLAVWLAQPLLRGWQGAGQRWLAIVPGVAPSQIAALRTDADRAVWLVPGVPLLDDTPSPGAGFSASVLRELDARLAPGDSLRVLVPEQLSGLDAMAITLSREVEWLVLPGASTAWPQTVAPSTRPRLVLRYADDADAALPYLQAAFAAWSTSPDVAVDVDVAAAGAAWPDSADALVLVGATPDASALALVERGATLLQIPARVAGARHDDAPAQAVWPPRPQRRGRGRLLQLQAPLEPSAWPILHAAQFPRVLHGLLFGQPPAPTRAIASQVRPTLGDHSLPPPDLPLRPWLAWLAAALFLAERVLANGRRLAGAT